MEFSNFDGSNGWYHYIDIKVTPSDPDARYVFDCLAVTSPYVDIAKTDEELIDSYVKVYGSNLTLRSGEYKKNQSFSSWGSWNNYRVIIFGYDGEATSALYMYEINTETGETTQLRPEIK